MDLTIKYGWHARAKKCRDGKIVLYTNRDKKKYRVGYLYFSVQETQINADNLRITKGYRGRGFGRLLMMILMALAEEVRKPIFLYGTEESDGFYKEIGMRRVFCHKDWNDVKVEFMNLNPKKKFCEQCSNMDYIWIPSGVTHIRLYL
jgi:GNAT superfamily N-acetyltransferase